MTAGAVLVVDDAVTFPLNVVAGSDVLDPVKNVTEVDTTEPSSLEEPELVALSVATELDGFGIDPKDVPSVICDVNDW